jgi:hypothetical protein
MLTHFLPKTAIKFYFEFCAFTKELSNRMVQMTLLKLLNNLQNIFVAWFSKKLRSQVHSRK